MLSINSVNVVKEDLLSKTQNREKERKKKKKSGNDGKSERHSTSQWAVEATARMRNCRYLCDQNIVPWVHNEEKVLW